MLSRIYRYVIFKIRFFLRFTVRQTWLAHKLDDTVFSGPFRGLKYGRISHGSVILPKLLGTYEDELHAILLSLSARNYTRYIDIGAADGYYAVGINKKILPGIHTIAYEMTKRGRRLLQKNIVRNNAENIHVKGYCNAKALWSDIVAGKRTLILMDIEGGESDLLMDRSINFRNCDILVELHPEVFANIRELIVERFSLTHEIQHIKQHKKKLPPISNPSVISASELFMNEFRGGDQSWIWLQSKTAIN